MTKPSPALAAAAGVLETHVTTQASQLAQATGVALPAAYSALLHELGRRLKAYSAVDGRAEQWRVRVRLYRTDRMNEPEADSDPDAAADAPGTEVVHGLPGVATHLAQLATHFHGSLPAGLEDATLRHRLKSLRPTLSRNGGHGVWRVPYQVEVGRGVAVLRANGFPPEIGLQDWLARVDVQREATNG